MLDTTRHMAFLENIDLGTEIHLIGCGSIGTVAGLTLRRMGFSNFILYDEDTIEPHNLANQYFETADLGKAKVDALEEKLKAIDEGVRVEKRGFFGEADIVPQGSIVVVGVDSMAARKVVASVLEGDVLLIDGRMGGENGQVHAVRKFDKQAWDTYCQSLYDDSQASELPCTARTIIYTVAITANIMAKLVLSFLSDTGKSYESYAVDMRNVVILDLVKMRSVPVLEEKKEEKEPMEWQTGDDLVREAENQGDVEESDQIISLSPPQGTITTSGQVYSHTTGSEPVPYDLNFTPTPQLIVHGRGAISGHKASRKKKAK